MEVKLNFSGQDQVLKSLEVYFRKASHFLGLNNIAHSEPKNRRRSCHGGSVIDSMESSATDCKEMSRGEHANRHDVRFVANLARNLGGCDQDIFGKISRSRTSLKGSSVIVTVTRTIRFVTGERRLHCQMPYLRLPMKY